MKRPLVGAAVLLACSTAVADDATAPPEAEGQVTAQADAAPATRPFEAGIYGGGFISNYYHQFYDIAIPDRQELERVNPLVGLRIAYFPTRWFGAELEGAWIMATTKVTKDSAAIHSVRAQAVFQHQLAARLVPFATLGLGVDRVSSDDDVLGTDIDMLLHVGGGLRVFATRSIALRAEARFLRGPSQQAPYHLNASYGEFLVGLSFIPGGGGGRAASATSHRVDVATTSDGDGDGIADASDRCPSEAEDKDLFDDGDGCPEKDNDADGIADAADQCPMEAEDKDGFSDDDGCADKDNDADGVSDAQDGCPKEAEDRDGFRDADGCPDPDNDEDGIVDGQDKCPQEAEAINGVDDNDGCPDMGDAAVVLSPDRLELFVPVTFQGSKIAKPSLNVLGQVGATLRRHRQILRLRVTVHVQPTKNPDRDQELSDKRAVAIRDWLVEYGIDKKRLEVRGFGSTKPLVPRTQKNSALVNDRVELIILERQ